MTAGVAYSIGENIAYGVGSRATAGRTVYDWMHSPPHRATMLNGSFHDGGVGLVIGTPSIPRRRATYTLDFGYRG